MRTLIIVSQIFSIPTIFAVLSYAMFGFDHLMGHGRILSKFVTGEIYAVISVISIISIMAVVGIFSILSSLILIFPLASKMRNYEEEMIKLYEQQKQYAEAKKRLIEAALKLKNPEP